MLREASSLFAIQVKPERLCNTDIAFILVCQKRAVLKYKREIILPAEMLVEQTFTWCSWEGT